MPEQDNKAGYLQFVRDVLDLYPDEEVVRQRIAEIKAVSAQSKRRDPDFTPYPTPGPEQILIEWDPHGEKKKLREQLDLTGENPERIKRLMLVVDEQVASLPDIQGAKIKEYYYFNEPGVDIPISTRGRKSWLYTLPMRMVRAQHARRISRHLLDESQGKLF